MVNPARVVITADDAGADLNIDRGILSLASTGILNRVALLVTYNPTWFLKNISRYPVKLGLHFNISSGYPLSKLCNIRCLINKEGLFISPTAECNANQIGPHLDSFIEESSERLVQNEIEREFNSQLKAFQSMVGRTPEFISVHHDLDRSQTVRQACCSIFPSLPPRQEALREGSLASYSYEFLSAVCTIPDAVDRISLLLWNAIKQSLENESSVSEVVCHPGYVPPTSSFTVYRKERFIELDAWSILKDREPFISGKRSSEGWSFESDVVDVTKG